MGSWIVDHSTARLLYAAYVDDVDDDADGDEPGGTTTGSPRLCWDRQVAGERSRMTSHHRCSQASAANCFCLPRSETPPWTRKARSWRTGSVIRQTRCKFRKAEISISNYITSTNQLHFKIWLKLNKTINLVLYHIDNTLLSTFINADASTGDQLIFYQVAK